VIDRQSNGGGEPMSLMFKISFLYCPCTKKWTRPDLTVPGYVTVFGTTATPSWLGWRLEGVGRGRAEEGLRIWYDNDDQGIQTSPL